MRWMMLMVALLGWMAWPAASEAVAQVGGTGGAGGATSRPATAPARAGGGAATRPVMRPASRPTAGAPAGVPQELAEIWKQLEPKRAEAVRLARSIEKADLPDARRNYGELLELTAKFNAKVATYAETSPLRYGSVAPKNGFPRGVWLFKAARAIEAYNTANKGEMAADEFEVLVKVNEYREALGLLPLELDSRLVDSARGHSQWMADTKEFSHDSDLPNLKTHAQRMSKAGYRWTSAGENIAYGTGELNTAAAMFKGWFDSPGHHKTMVGDYTHLGVGHVDVYWTQNFGTGEPAKAIPKK